MVLDTDTLLEERSRLKAQLDDVPKIRRQISLLDKLIALSGEPSFNGRRRRGAVVEEGEEVYLCEKCPDRAFPTRHGLIMHTARMHKKGKK